MSTNSPYPPNPPKPVSPLIVILLSLLCLILVAWFFFAWLVLDRHLLDALGESLGTAFFIGLIVSVIGSIHNSRNE